MFCKYHVELDCQNEEEVKFRVASLFNLHRYSDCISLIDKGLAGCEHEPKWAIRARASVACRRRDEEKAEKYLRALIGLDEKDIFSVIQLARLLALAGKSDECIEILGKIEHGDIESPEIHIEIARTLYMVEEWDAMFCNLFSALRMSPEDPDVQFMFFTMFIEAEGKLDVGEPEVLDGEVGATFVFGNGNIKKCMVVDSKPVALLGEVDRTEPYVAGLIGEVVGAECSVPGLGKTGRVVLDRLCHKYIYVFEWIRNNFFTYDPAQTRMAEVSLSSEDGDDPVGGLLDYLRKSSDADRNMYQIFEAQCVPMGVLKDRNPSDVYAGLVKYSSRGFPAEHADYSSALESIKSPVVVLTYLGLKTLQLIGGLDLLEGLGKKLLLSPGLLEKIREDNVLTIRKKRVSASVGSTGDGALFLGRTKIEIWLQRKRVLLSLISGLEKHSDSVPLPECWGADEEEMTENVSEENVHALVLARENQAVIHTDDIHLRRWGEQLFSLRGFSTYALVEYSRMEGRIDEERYLSMMEELFLLRHMFMPFNAKVFSRVIGRSVLYASSEVKQILRYVSSPLITVEYAVCCAVSILKDIGAEYGIAGYNSAASEEVFQSLFEGRDEMEVRKLFIDAVGSELRLLPRCQDFLSAYIRDFTSCRRDGGRIICSLGL